MKNDFLFLGNINELGKTGGVIDSQVSQHLAVDFDVLLLQTRDELGIAQAVQAACSVDTGDPQAAEIALAEPTADVSITQGTANLFTGSAILL